VFVGHHDGALRFHTEDQVLDAITPLATATVTVDGSGDVVRSTEAVATARDRGRPSTPRSRACGQPRQHDALSSYRAVMSSKSRTLADAATAWQRRQLTGVEFIALFVRSTVYCRSRDTAGLVAWGEPGHGLIGVFSDLPELALACGAVPWLSTTGADLLAMWPPGYAMGIDVASKHAVRVDDRWLLGMAALMPA
jgi:hypothetical protein